MRSASEAAAPVAASGLVSLPALESDGDRIFRFRVRPDSRCFDGHFEGMPILPGVGHLAMVTSACTRRAGRELVLAGARDLRFQRPLGPDDEVEVALDDAAEPLTTRFEVRCRGEVASRGTLLFEASEPIDDRRR